MSNFTFLESDWPSIYQEAKEAEKHTLISPKASAIIARSALEKAVQWLYDTDEYLEWPYDRKLSSLIHEHCFRNILEPLMFQEINLIRTTGNQAAHGKVVTQNQSIASIKYLFRFLSHLGLYYKEDKSSIPSFSMDEIPDGSLNDKTLQKLKELDLKLAKQNAKERKER